MTRKQLIAKMVETKIRMKKAEMQYKAFQEEFLEEYGDEKITTPKGVFTKQERKSYVCINKTKLIKLLGLPAYKEHSTISKSGIEKTIGSAGFAKSLKEKCMKLSKVSKYYVFKEKK